MTVFFNVILTIMKLKRRFMICFIFQLIIILKWKYNEGVKLILSVILFDRLT